MKRSTSFSTDIKGHKILISGVLTNHLFNIYLLITYFDQTLSMTVDRQRNKPKPLLSWSLYTSGGPQWMCKKVNIYYVLWCSCKPDLHKTTALIISICPFPWCKYSHHGQFQAFNVLTTPYQNCWKCARWFSWAGITMSDSVSAREKKKHGLEGVGKMWGSFEGNNNSLYRTLKWHETWRTQGTPLVSVWKKSIWDRRKRECKGLGRGGCLEQEEGCCDCDREDKWMGGVRLDEIRGPHSPFKGLPLLLEMRQIWIGAKNKINIIEPFWTIKNYCHVLPPKQITNPKYSIDILLKSLSTQVSI